MLLKYWKIFSGCYPADTFFPDKEKQTHPFCIIINTKSNWKEKLQKSKKSYYLMFVKDEKCKCFKLLLSVTDGLSISNETYQSRMKICMILTNHNKT